MTQRFLSTVLLFLYMSMTGAQTTSSQMMQHIAAYNDTIFGVKTIVEYCIYNHRTTKTNQKYPSVNL